MFQDKYGAWKGMREMTATFRYLIGILEEEEQRGWKVLLLLNLISPVLDLFSFSLIIYIVNIVVREQHVSQQTVAFTVFMSIMMIVKGLFDLYKCKVQSRFVYDGSHKISMKLYELLMKEKLMHHNQKSQMQAVALVRNDTLNCMNIIIDSVEVRVNIFTLFGFYMVLIYVSKWFGAISSILFTLFMIGIFFYYRLQMNTYGKRSRAYMIKTNAQITVAFGNFKEMKLADDPEAVLHKYRDASMEYAAIQRDYQMNKSIVSVVMQNCIMTVAYIAVICILLEPREKASVLIVSMAMYFTILIRMLPIAYRIIFGLNQIEFCRKSYEVVKQELNEYEKIKKTEKAEENIRRRDLTFRKGISIRNLTFAYTDRVRIFDGAEIDIPAGYSVAVIGTSGIGKTTFLDLILGLLEPQSGNIIYDDYDIVTHTDANGTCKADLGKIVSYIPQTVFLNGETIKNNVDFFVDEDRIDEVKVIECLKCAQVWEDVKRMPEGIDTLIGENGTTISGGQRQRIAMARALYKDFEILIMDEATAALDMETEKAVIDSIRQVKGSKTILLVTHHMSLANECDMVYKIENMKFVRMK